jgi:outer membrane protein assembly factor BamD
MNRLTFRALLCLAAIVLSGCSSNPPITASPGEADKILLERGNAELKDRNWATARQYFSELLESYPQSPLRAEAKLGVGDAFLGEGNSASYVYAQNEYREFLAFYPTNPRADYAQMQLAMVHFNQMLNPQRDQTETKEAIRELQVFVERYPNSPLLPQVKEHLREAKDRLSDWDVAVGTTYVNMRWFAGAEQRFRHVLEHDPEYRRKDTLYFRLAEALERSGRLEEALPYYERLVREFEKSEHMEETTKRIELLKQKVKGAPKAK